MLHFVNRLYLNKAMLEDCLLQHTKLSISLHSMIVFPSKMFSIEIISFRIAVKFNLLQFATCTLAANTCTKNSIDI